MQNETSKHAFEQFKLTLQVHQSFKLQIGTNHFQYIVMHLEKRWGAHYPNWTKMGMTIPFILLASD
jgi:hypothetical protein